MTRERCSSLPLVFACPPSRHGAITVKETHEGGPLGTAVHSALVATVAGATPDLDAIALRYSVDRKELGILSWYGARAWEALAPSFPDPETEVSVENENLTGHPDLRSRVGTQLRLADWKSGRVDGDYYHQVMGYVCCEMDADPSITDAVFTVVWLREQDTETYCVTRAQVEEWRQELRSVLANATGFRTGTHCKYCPRSVDCPALMAVVRRDVEMFSAEEPGALLDGATPDQLIAVLRRAKVVARFAEGAEKLVRERIRQSGPLVGSDGTKLVLVAENGKREIDALRARPVLRERLTEEELAACITVSASKAEEAVAEKATRGGKGAAKKELADALEAAGAVTKTTVEKLREVRPPKELSK